MLKLRYLFFLLIAFYVGLLVFFGLPAVHSWHDPVVVRDTGTVWDTLSWQIQGNGRYSIPVAVMCHVEGPLQFLFLNAYCYLIGDLLPLNPTTTQIPHAMLTFLCTIFFYLLGKKVYSEKFGYLCAVMFVLSPWLPITARRTEVFILFSVLFELAALYFYIGYMADSERTLYKIAAPVSLAFYLTGAMDWPSFFFILFLLLIVNKKLGQALKNPYNIFPVLILLSYLVFSASTFYVDGTPCHIPNMFIAPFVKGLSSDTNVSPTPLLSMLRYVVKAFGPGGLLAIIGLVFFFLSKKILFFRQNSQTPLQKKFFIVMAVWLVVFPLPLLKFAASLSLQKTLEGFLTYAYVLGIPVTIFSARLLSKEKKAFLTTGGICLMMWMQWSVIVTNEQTFTYPDHDRRVVAAAAFLIEQRPDLLQPGKLALLPGDKARSVGQYMRGENFTASIAANFPQIIENTLRDHPEWGTGGVLGDLIMAYKLHGEMKADWLMLTPDLLQPGPENQSFDFYRRLYVDPQISWIACFQDTLGRKIWLGEVKPDGTPIEMAKVYDVDPLADRYEEKYNRIRFLKRNVKYLLHY